MRVTDVAGGPEAGAGTSRGGGKRDQGGSRRGTAPDTAVADALRRAGLTDDR